jgi:hypothetical protein
MEEIMLDKEEVAALHFYKNDILLESRTDNGSIAVKVLGADQLFSAIKNIRVDSGWLTSGVKRWGMTDGEPWFIALFPAEKQRIWLEDRKTKTEVPMPALVFAGRGESYWMLAARKDKFEPDLELFWLALPNFQVQFQNREICWGTNKVLAAESKNIEAMWKMYWNSPFTEDGVDALKALEGKREFPKALMSEKFGTIHELARQLARKEDLE